MVPVMILSDGYIANGSEPWKIPEMSGIPSITVSHPEGTDENEPFLPYARDEYLARPWAIPGTPGLMHRVGGLEKEAESGNVSYDPANHEHMTEMRAAKVSKIAERIPLQDVSGPTSGDVLVLSWGGTYGACHTAVGRCRADGHSVSHAHLRYLNPMPSNIGELVRAFKKVIVAELNSGQLRLLLRAEHLVDCVGVNKVQGKPFTVTELVAAIQQQSNAVRSGSEQSDSGDSRRKAC
jgi:2-oxoglutarate ferredoxin oxidoreductase subunit alpha